jgi:hypothetical protein
MSDEPTVALEPSPAEPTSPAVPAPEPPAGDVPPAGNVPPGPPTAAPPASAAPAARKESGRVLATIRSIAVGLVFVLTLLSLVLAVTTGWLHATVMQTDRFVALTAPLAENPDVQNALAEVTATQVDEALDLGPIGQYVVGGVTRELYSSEAFATLWEGAIRLVHEQLVAFLRGETTRLQLVDGQLVLNLYPLYDRVAERVNALNLEIAGRSIALPDISNPADPAASKAELEAALGRTLSPTFGTVPIAEAQKLENVQRYVQLFDALVWVLFLVTALLAVLTLVLARRRLRMVALLAIGSLASLLAARLLIASLADGLATALAGTSPGATIGAAITTAIADDYREFGRLVLLAALVVAIGATLAVWALERRAGAEAGLGTAAGGWFLALAGLCVVLGGLLVTGLTAVTGLVAVVVYVAWVALIAWWLRSRAKKASAAGPPAAATAG